VAELLNSLSDSSVSGRAQTIMLPDI